MATAQDANTSRNLNVKVMIGGSRVHHEFAMTIGTDASGNAFEWGEIAWKPMLKARRHW